MSTTLQFYVVSNLSLQLCQYWLLKGLGISGKVAVWGVQQTILWFCWAAKAKEDLEKLKRNKEQLVLIVEE
jgi:hypothetical protein